MVCNVGKTESCRDILLATNSSQGIVPVKKKSNAFPPESEKPKLDTLIQLNSPKMATPAPPPLINQSDVLKLLKSTSFPFLRL